MVRFMLARFATRPREVMAVSEVKNPGRDSAGTTTDAVKTRMSVRAFLDQPVGPTVIREVLELAARAPSGGNLQPWRIVVVGGAELDRLKQVVANRLATKPEPDAAEYPIYPPNLDDPYRTQRFRVGEAMYRLLGIERADKAGRRAWFQRNYEFFGAPLALFCYVDRAMGSAQWSDLGMYLQSVMLLLRERGLDSCPQECWSVYHATIDGFLQAPPERMLFCGMSIGYADPAAPVNQLVSERMPLAEFAEFRGI